MLIRRLLLGGILLLAAAGLLLGASAYVVRDWLRAPLGLPDGQVVEVIPGTSLTRFTDELASQGWLQHPRWLTLLARWRGDATRIQAGEYRLRAGDTPDEFLDMLVAGEVVLHEVTLVEGWTVREAVAAVRRHPRIVTTDSAGEPARLVEALGLTSAAEEPVPTGGAQAWRPLEGWLFPDTYRFPAGTTDLVVLRQAHVRMEQELAEAWASRAAGLPFGESAEMLTLASIVEKETALAAERPRIAGVFVSRLEQGMRLQSDPTVIYGLGDDFDGDIRRRDLRADTPYNTYTRHGLPPTPIALAGRAALRAVADPQIGDALYFVATGNGDGSHYFSATLDEHNAAVKRYLERTRGDEKP